MWKAEGEQDQLEASRAVERLGCRIGPSGPVVSSRLQGWGL